MLTVVIADFHLTRPDDFAYLNQSGCTVVEGIDDAEEFRDTMARLFGLIRPYTHHRKL